MPKKPSEAFSEAPSELQQLLAEREGGTALPPLWRRKGHYKKGHLVQRRRGRHESEETSKLKYGLGLVIREVERMGEWTHVEVYWQGLKAKMIEHKKDVRRVPSGVEKVVLPESTFYNSKEQK